MRGSSQRSHLSRQSGLKVRVQYQHMSAWEHVEGWAFAFQCRLGMFFYSQKDDNIKEILSPFKKMDVLSGIVLLYALAC